MYGLPDDDPTGIETCRSFESFNVTQLCKYKVVHLYVNYRIFSNLIRTLFTFSEG